MAETKYYGKYRAIVVDVNDPERRGRIRVQCPAVLGVYKSAWCEPCIPYATDFAGDYYVPPVNEAIWVEFEEGNVDKPIWNGGWYKIDSSPLLPEAKPDDYRFISFKNSILRMGDKEFLFEIRNGENSYVFTVDSSTIRGLTYIGSKSEQELSDLEELILNKKIILEDYATAIKELQTAMQELSQSFSDFISQGYTPDMEAISGNFRDVHESLNTVSSKITEVDTNITDLDTRVTDNRQYCDDLYQDLYGFPVHHTGGNLLTAINKATSGGE